MPVSEKPLYTEGRDSVWWAKAERGTGIGARPEWTVMTSQW